MVISGSTDWAIGAANMYSQRRRKSQSFERHCKLPTEKIKDAQSFNFAFKFPLNWFLSPNFAFLDGIFSDKK